MDQITVFSTPGLVLGGMDAGTVRQKVKLLTKMARDLRKAHYEDLARIARQSPAETLEKGLARAEKNLVEIMKRTCKSPQKPARDSETPPQYFPPTEWYNDTKRSLLGKAAFRALEAVWEKNHKWEPRGSAELLSLPFFAELDQQSVWHTAPPARSTTSSLSSCQPVAERLTGAGRPKGTSSRQKFKVYMHLKH